jgi:hypothetical protein
MPLLRVITLAGDATQETVVARSLEERPDVELVMRCVDRVEASAAIRGADLDALITVGVPNWLDQEVVEEAQNAGIRLVAVGIGGSRPAIISAVAWAFASQGASASEIVRRCTDNLAPPPPPPSGQPTSPKGVGIAVWGPKGSPGRTTTALEVARELAVVDASTFLVDADPYGGDLLQTAGIVEDLPTVVWAAQLAGRHQFHAGRVVASLRRVDQNGPILLPGLPRGDLWAEVSPYGWRQLVVAAKAMFTYSIFDVGACLEGDESPYGDPHGGRNAMTRLTLKAADQVLAVCRADPIGIKNFIWAFDSLTSIVDPDRVVIAANQVLPGKEREIADLLRRHVGKRPLAYLPRTRPGSARRRRTTTEERALSTAMRSLVATLGAPVGARGVLASLSGRA